MTESCSHTGWTGERGEKWLRQLAQMEAMLAPVDEPLIRALSFDAPCRIADVGCGGGGTSLELVRRAPAGSVVHGFDISPALIDVARERRSANGVLDFEVADMATAIPPQAPYDRLVSRFGIMFLADPPAAFGNLLRWLVPGGRFAFAVWASPAENAWMTVVRETVAEIISLPSFDFEAPGPFRYSTPDKLLLLLEQAGFGELEVSDWRGTLPLGGALPAAEAAAFALASFSSFAEMLAEAGDRALGHAKEILAERLAGHDRDGAVRMEACVHIITGMKTGAAGANQA